MWEGLSAGIELDAATARASGGGGGGVAAYVESNLKSFRAKLNFINMMRRTLRRSITWVQACMQFWQLLSYSVGFLRGCQFRTLHLRDKDKSKSPKCCQLTRTACSHVTNRILVYCAVKYQNCPNVCISNL
jgi:hypothetical protein